MLSFSKISQVVLQTGFAVLTVFLPACASRDVFTSRATSQAFVQNYNPEQLDILWVVDDRSPMFRVRQRLVAEATKFFTRLDSATQDYQMAFISMDNEIAHGDLKPNGSATILKKTVGTVDQRVSLFSSVLSQILNLRTGASNQGFEAARLALTGPFKPRANVPLVLVFISDSDDRSPLRTSDAVQEYGGLFTQLKDGKKDLVRAYSINYLAIPSGSIPTDATRCATRYNADIDLDAPLFEDNYFRLARYFAPSNTQVTADLCSSFANLIDLSGLKLQQLPRRFRLDAAARPDSVKVGVSKDSGKESFSLTWHYDATTQEVVFDVTPPEGTTITVTYLPG